MPNIIKRANDPYLYLNVRGEWYAYNTHDQPIGGGAMGDVYRGYRLRDGYMIAVKKVKDHFANQQVIRDRARQEASLTFRHPNLVEMIGCCEYAPDYGPIFILSNYVHGENVDKFLSQFHDSTVRVDKVCYVVCSVLDALLYIHSKGLVHRDIKPSNIMVENSSNIRLMDLGIARLNGGNQFSSYGFIGTPEYSAPELILRSENVESNKSINATTDLYELGITFYELLTGVNPMIGNSDSETLSRQIKKSLPYHPSIPRRIMKVIWKATEKEQNKRYQTALEFKQAIQKAQTQNQSFTDKVLQWYDYLKNRNVWN